VQQRSHAFWDCSVAAAVIEQVCEGLRVAGNVAAVTRESVWLLRTPTGFDSPGTWAVVALAALSAMEFGRKQLWARSLQPDWVGTGAGAAALEVGRSASARFWGLLDEFCAGADATTLAPLWGITATSPFIVRVSSTNPHRLAIRRPAV
jgi:hypothetical protein